VDDEQDISTIFKRGLEMRGYAVDVYNDPHLALSGFRVNLYDIILIDVRMPGLTGFDLARAIWQKDSSAMIWLMTAFEIYEDEAKKVFKDLKNHCFLKKPLTPNALAAHIEKHLPRPET
jgi:two-component system response regulator RegX3